MNTFPAHELIPKLLDNDRSCLFVLALGFEERCLGIPRLLSRTLSCKHRVVCVKLDDDNVSPAAVDSREDIRKQMDELIQVEYLSAVDVLNHIDRAIEDGHCVGIDASTMPRKILFDILFRAATNNFRDVQLYYAQPQDYSVESEFEVESPNVEAIFREVIPKDFADTAVVLFPGFSSNESTMILSWIMARRAGSAPLCIRWTFCHPGSRYSFYERALEAHAALLQHLDFNTKQPRRDPMLCRMDDMDNVAEQIVNVIYPVRTSAVLYVAVLGPRILLGPVFLTVSALRSQGVKAEILVTQQLAYRFVRSLGCSFIHAWDLEQAHRRIFDRVKRDFGRTRESTSSSRIAVTLFDLEKHE